MHKAQASIEYVLLIGILLMIVIPLFYYATEKSSTNIRLSQAEDVVVSLAQAAEQVYALGPGSKVYVWVVIPSGVQSTSVAGSEISLTMGIYGNMSDVTAVTRAPVTGNITTQRGTRKIPVEYLESGIVLIGEGEDTGIPTITWKSPQNQACNPITIRVTTSESANCKVDTIDTSYETMSTTLEGSSLSHNYEFGVQSEGAYTYFVRCQDAFENTMNTSEAIAYSINFTQCAATQQQTSNETDSPTITLISPDPSAVVNTSLIDFFYSVTDASSISSCSLSVNETILATVLQPTKDVTNNLTEELDKGTYIWYIGCTDSIGNKGNSSSRQITVNATLDNDVPLVSLTSPTNGSIQNLTNILFVYNVTDITSAINSCTLSVRSTLTTGLVSGQTVTDSSVAKQTQKNFSLVLQDGKHDWNISCYDASAYANKGVSQNFLFNLSTAGSQPSIVSCAGYCAANGYENGVCRQESTKCTQNGEVHLSGGNQYCTGGAQSDTCCCVPDG